MTRRASITRANAFSASLSPPLWKDQLRQRCMARLRQNRHELLAKLRSPNANIADEMKRIVVTEGRRKAARHPVFDLQRDDDADGEENDAMGSIEDLVVVGQLSEDDYLDIVHALEDELRYEWDADDEDERLAEEMMEFEEASLAAMLAGMDIDGSVDAFEDDQAFGEEIGEAGEGIHALCPVCKAGSLRESASGDSHVVVSCSCGFSLRVKNILHGALEDLQEKISDAYMAHREECHVDPIFSVFSDLDSENEVTDSLLMSCSACGHECLVR